MQRICPLMTLSSLIEKNKKSQDNEVVEAAEAGPPEAEEEVTEEDSVVLEIEVPESSKEETKEMSEVPLLSEGEEPQRDSEGVEVAAIFAETIR